jgi:hypothetical protein
MSVRECDRANEQFCFMQATVWQIFLHSEATEHAYRYIKRESRVREESAPSESVMRRSKIKYAYLRLTHKSTKLFFTKPFSP